MTPADCPGCAQERQARERAERERDEFKRIGQGFERDMRTTFEQSCKNLARAEAAESALSAARGECAALRKIVEAAREAVHRITRTSGDGFSGEISCTGCDDVWRNAGQAKCRDDCAWKALDALLSSVPK